MRIIVQSAMHGRYKTVKKCLDYLMIVADNLAPDIDLCFIYGYTNKEDGNLLESYSERLQSYKVGNIPLWNKFHQGFELMKGQDFDAVICIGSDDIFNEDFVRFITEQIQNYDHIAFSDIYFYSLQTERHYRWPGYTNHRKGEPAGAGKTYSKESLEPIDYKVFQPSKDIGLDAGTFDLIKDHGLSYKFFSLKEEGLYLCDIKDGQGLTPLERFFNLESGEHEQGLPKP